MKPEAAGHERVIHSVSRKDKISGYFDAIATSGYHLLYALSMDMQRYKTDPTFRREKGFATVIYTPDRNNMFAALNVNEKKPVIKKALSDKNIPVAETRHRAFIQLA